MHAKLARLSAVFVLLILTACAGTPVRNATTAAELAEMAVVLLSVSHDLNAGNGANAIFYLDNDALLRRAVLRSVQDTLSIPTPSDFTDRRGHLYILEVTPGHHQIDGWQVVSAGLRISSEAAIAPLTFEVKKGEVLYVGALHANLAIGLTLFGVHAAYDAMPVVVDNSQQDIRLAESKVPAIKGKVRTALLPLGPWAPENGRLKRLDPVPVPALIKK